MIRSKELRQQYPEIAIPAFHIPVTISNNVPGTEYVRQTFGASSSRGRSGVPHAEESGRHSVVQFVLEAEVEEATHFIPRAVL
jgi:hypothetical protein